METRSNSGITNSALLSLDKNTSSSKPRHLDLGANKNYKTVHILKRWEEER